LNIIGCLDRPTSGNYFFEGIDTTTLSDHERAGLRSQRIGFVFQSFHLLPHRSVLENVMLADVYRKQSQRGRRERALAAIAETIGVNPQSGKGESVQVVSRNGSVGLLHGMTRSVALGDVVLDGQWHQGPKGKYCATIQHEADGVSVRSIKVEMVPSVGGKKTTATYMNRGAEVGKASVGAASNCIVVSPSFTSLEGQPTDWNDLAVGSGMDHVKHQIGEQVERGISEQWWSDFTRQPVKGGIAEAHTLADACRLLEATNSSKEVENLVAAIDERFVKQEISMSGQDWNDWSRAIEAKVAAFVRSEPAAAAGIER
ncbi:partial putative ABC transporter ATP-binding protein YknY, partial [Rhodocyclaceae bacterium]